MSQTLSCTSPGVLSRVDATQQTSGLNCPLCAVLGKQDTVLFDQGITDLVKGLSVYAIRTVKFLTFKSSHRPCLSLHLTSKNHSSFLLGE